MNLPTLKHGRVFRISGVEIQLVTFAPLTDDQAARVAMYLWRTEEQVRKSAGQRLTLHWAGDASLAEQLPPLPPLPR